jgi:hypothetical protein
MTNKSGSLEPLHSPSNSTPTRMETQGSWTAVTDWLQSRTHRRAITATIVNPDCRLTNLFIPTCFLLMYPEPSSVPANVLRCHAQGKFDSGTILHQAHICMDPVYSKSSRLVCCATACVGRCFRQPSSDVGFVTATVRRPAPSPPRFWYEFGRRGQEALQRQRVS